MSADQQLQDTCPICRARPGQPCVIAKRPSRNFHFERGRERQASPTPALDLIARHVYSNYVLDEPLPEAIDERAIARLRGELRELLQEHGIKAY